MGNLTIPSAMIPRLREGAQLQLCYGAEGIRDSVTVTAHQKDGPPLEARALTGGAWGLLDALGWNGAAPVSITLDVCEHGVALKDGIGILVPILTDIVAELADHHPTRDQRADELQALRRFEQTLHRATARYTP